MKANWIKTMTKSTGRVAVAAVFCGAMAFAQGNGNNQTSGQAGTANTAQSVVVTNTTAQPVPVRSREDAAYQPYIFANRYVIASGNNLVSNVSDTVPAGKRLILDAITVNMEVSSPGVGVTASASIDRAFTTGTYGFNTEMPFGLSKYSSNTSSTDMWGITTLVKAYFSPGETFTLKLRKSNDVNGQYTGSALGSYIIYGHYVDIP